MKLSLFDSRIKPFLLTVSIAATMLTGAKAGTSIGVNFQDDWGGW